MAVTLSAPVTPVETHAPLRRLRFRALGTHCEVQYVPPSPAAAAAFEAEAVAWVARFEARCTRFRTDSVVGRINALAGSGEWVALDEEMERYFDVCATLHTWSAGLLDVTAGPLERLWDYRVPQPRLPTDAELRAAQAKVGWTLVQRKPGAIRLPVAGMELDFGGWGKEYAVDRVVALARAQGIEQALVDFGHDIFALGTPPGRRAWHVGLEDPQRPGTSCGSLAIHDRGVAGSGDYLRGFTLDGRRYGHIVDPRTGWPVDNGCQQVTVVAPSCLQAGILATTVFILGPVAGMRLLAETMGVEGRIAASAAVYQSRGFFHHVVS